VNYSADKIHTCLFQGGAPPTGDALAKAGIDVLVLCAAENQDASVYNDIEVICAPGDDDPRVSRMMQFVPIWTKAAALVAERVRTGKNVLVTCMAGQNRSGMVTAIALHYLTGMTGEECVEHLQSRRMWALHNDTFAKYIEETFL
jgi:protein-tyrosine phosphatase